MGHRTGFVWGVLTLLAAAMPAPAQTLSNQSLSGQYFFRHVSLGLDGSGDRKSTRLNSSHLGISYAVFCLKKKNCELVLKAAFVTGSLADVETRLLAL